MKIFVVYGLVIGCVGTALGVALGTLSCLAIRKFGVGLDPEVYYIAQLPVRMNPFEFLTVSLSALVVSYLATIYPSLQAARLSPVDGLRYD
jgi:lipoprotein-releasing system permease protein